ncbi:MAG TPA: restriction endonuclease, partial [Clostridiaceae bacterium]|nr:restriction endonuclease [Clostridiaceae bacterium]
MNDNISLFWKSLYEIGITNKNNIMREALRVKKTASYIEGDINDEEEIYSTMKNKVEKELGYFPGDKDTFIKLFKIGWNFDIIEFTIETYKSDRTKMVIVPDYLIESMNKIIEDKDPNNILIGDAEKTLVGLEGIIKNFPNKKFTLLTEQK